MSGAVSNGAAAGSSRPPTFTPIDPPPRQAGLSHDGAFDALRKLREKQAAPDQPQPQPQQASDRGDPRENEPEPQQRPDPTEQYHPEGGGQPAAEIELPGPDGRMERVSVAELAASRMRQADYTRKTQAVAAQERQIAEQQAQLAQLTQLYTAQLNRFTTERAKEFAQPVDWEKLAREDPLGYNEKRARYDMLLDAAREQQQLQQRAAQQQAAQRAELLAKADAVLRQRFPAWADPSGRTKLQGDIADYLITAEGFEPPELDIHDARMFTVAWKAMMWDRLQKQKLEPKEPEPTRPAPRGTPPAPQQSRRVRDAEDRFYNSSQSLDDGFRLMQLYKMRPSSRR